MIPAGETLRLAGIALTRNKMRSFLTALGIIIGVGAVIFMQSIGEGAKSRVRAQIEGAGTNIVMLFSGTSQGPGGREDGPVRHGPVADREEVGRRARDLRIPGVGFRDHRLVGVHLRRDRSHRRQLGLDGAQVFPGDRGL